MPFERGNASGRADVRYMADAILKFACGIVPSFARE
jgi:hypothetical protein